VPLFVEGLHVGRLNVAGDRPTYEQSVCDAVEQLTELLKPFEQKFAQLAAMSDLCGSHSNEKALLTEPMPRHRENLGLEATLPAAELTV
jgi:hypothetical protein